MKRFAERVLDRVGIIGLVIVLVLGWNVFTAFAQTIELRWKNALLAEGTDCDDLTGNCFFLLVSGLDSNNQAQPLAVGTDGILDVDISGSGGSLGVSTQADDLANTQDTIAVSSLNYGYESVGGVWDRWRIDTSGNGFVSLGTGLDGSIDEVSVQFNAVTPQLDSTDRMAVSIYGFNAAAGDTQPTVTTTQADDLANTLDTLNVTAFLQAFDGTTWDRLYNTATQADDVANTVDGLNTTSFLQGFDGTDWDRIRVFSGSDDVSMGDGTDDGLLGSMSIIMGYDEDDTNFDRIYSYDTDGDNVATEAEGVTLGVTNFQLIYDSSTNATYDRLTQAMVLQAGVPGTAVVLGVDNASSCSSALSLGHYRFTPVSAGETVAYCCRAATSCTATTSDTPYVDGQYYLETVTDAAANDVVCCIAATGTNSINLFMTPMTM